MNLMISFWSGDFFPIHFLLRNFSKICSINGPIPLRLPQLLQYQNTIYFTTTGSLILFSKFFYLISICILLALRFSSKSPKSKSKAKSKSKTRVLKDLGLWLTVKSKRPPQTFQPFQRSYKRLLYHSEVLSTFLTQIQVLTLLMWQAKSTLKSSD